MKNIKWQCPDCKRVGDIEEVVEGIDQVSPVLLVDDGVLEYGPPEYVKTDSVMTVGYSCRWCGCPVRDDQRNAINTVAGFIKYMSDNKLLEDENG